MIADRDAITSVFDHFGTFWHRYEAHGAEQIPLHGPALLVFYHGFMPLDAWYFGSWYYRTTGRLVRGLGDRWLFKTPVLADVVREMGAVPGEPDAALDLLRAGELVGVAPGGTREAIQGRPTHYHTQWGHRLGFARLAIEANVPVFPAFTENVEEIYRSPLVWTRPIQALYERTRWPIVPIVGLGALPLPVKLTTWIGAPIAPSDHSTPESLRDATRASIDALIAEHQCGRPRIARALAARIRSPGPRSTSR